LHEARVDQASKVLGHQALAESGLLDALRDAALAVEQQAQQQETVGLADGGEDGGQALIGIQGSAPDGRLRTRVRGHSAFLRTRFDDCAADTASASATETSRQRLPRCAT
jgi:hypothetical protein